MIMLRFNHLVHLNGYEYFQEIVDHFHILKFLLP